MHSMTGNILSALISLCIISVALKAFVSANFYQFLSWAYHASLLIVALAGFAGLTGDYMMTPDACFLLLISVNVLFLLFTRITERKND